MNKGRPKISHTGGFRCIKPLFINILGDVDQLPVGDFLRREGWTKVETIWRSMSLPWSILNRKHSTKWEAGKGATTGTPTLPLAISLAA